MWHQLKETLLWPLGAVRCITGPQRPLSVGFLPPQGHSKCGCGAWAGSQIWRATAQSWREFIFSLTVSLLQRAFSLRKDHIHSRSSGSYGFFKRDILNQSNWKQYLQRFIVNFRFLSTISLGPVICRVCLWDVRILGETLVRLTQTKRLIWFCFISLIITSSTSGSYFSLHHDKVTLKSNIRQT